MFGRERCWQAERVNDVDVAARRAAKRGVFQRGASKTARPSIPFPHPSSAASVVVIAALGIIGCTRGQMDPSWPGPSPLGRDIPAYRPAREPPGKGVQAKEPTGAITLRDALALALMRSPELAAVSWEVRAAEAKAIQAGTMPNPEIRVRWDDWGGTGAMRGTRNSDQTIRLSQVIELGDKARKRRTVGRLEAALGGWDYETKRLDVFAQTAKAFVEALAAEKRFALARERQRLAEPVLSAAIQAGKSGAVRAWDEAKARVELAARRIAVERARREMTAARAGLAVNWGSREPKFTGLIGDLEAVSDVPAVEKLLARVSGGPQVARWETEARLRQAVVELEKANAIPDLRVLGGMRREEDTTDRGYFLALEIEVPIFDRSQGAAMAARYKRIKAGYERLAAIAAASATLGQAHRMLSASHLQAVALDKEIIPAARRGFDVARQAFEKRQLPWKDLLAAQRTLFGAKADLIDALAAYHLAVADIERLTGRPLHPRKEAEPPARRRQDRDSPKKQP